jgi:hypothetical protein
MWCDVICGLLINFLCWSGVEFSSLTLQLQLRNLARCGCKRVKVKWSLGLLHLGLRDRPSVHRIQIIPPVTSRGTPHHAERETSISEGRKLYIGILPSARNELQLMGSFTYPKVGTWDRLFDFPSEGRHDENFFYQKNPTASAGFEPANSGTRGQHANP